MNFKDKIKDLKPYDLNCNVFDVYSYNGLSMQELLCQFFHKINDCIKVSNDTIDLASWLVNEGIPMEVANKFTSLIEDGTLENMINDNLFNSLNTEIDNLNSQLNTEIDNLDSQLNTEIDNLNSQLALKASKTELEVEKKRIDKFTSLSEGSTTGDAELIDGRVGSDGITYNNLGEAIRTQINDINTNISDVVEKVPLSIGIDQAFIQSYNSQISTEGASVFSISKPLSIKKYQKIIVYAEGYKEGVSIISKCNNDGTYTKLVTSSTGKHEYVYESNEDIDIVICSNTRNYNWKLYIVKTNYDVTKNVMDALIGSDGLKYNNLHDAITSQVGKVYEKIETIKSKVSDLEQVRELAYINDKFISPNGTVYTHGQYNPSLCVTENIDVKHYKNILIENLNFTADGVCSLAFYDENNSVVRVHTYSGVVDDLNLTIPKNTKYVRFTSKITQVHNIKVYLLTDLKDKIESLENIFNEYEKKSKFNYCKMFHKIGGVGDSLMSGVLIRYNNTTGEHENKHCYNMSWLSNLAKDINAECVHYSRGGLTTKTWLENYLDILKNESVKPDAYYIGLGTNDQWRLEGGLGTQSDCGSDKETFYGLYSKIINEIKQFNPNAIIFCCSLYFKDQMKEEFNEAIKYMSNLYDCYFIDFIGQYGDLYLGSNNNVYIDGGHFNTLGYVRAGEHILNITNNIIENNYSDFRFIGMD